MSVRVGTRVWSPAGVCLTRNSGRVAVVVGGRTAEVEFRILWVEIDSLCRLVHAVGFESMPWAIHRWTRRSARTAWR
jgi:hypothetical protein